MNYVYLVINPIEDVTFSAWGAHGWIVFSWCRVLQMIRVDAVGIAPMPNRPGIDQFLDWLVPD